MGKSGWAFFVGLKKGRCIYFHSIASRVSSVVVS
jgi:hypothetical protein